MQPIKRPLSNNFNSYMVRLKDANKYTEKQTENNFNSYMVRLKDRWRIGKKKRYLILQFLYGTIKSLSKSLLVTYLLLNFNSYMVRLKDLKSLYYRLFLILFQFLYGTIKSLLLRKDYRFHLDFNSYMVRLKAKCLWLL